MTHIFLFIYLLLGNVPAETHNLTVTIDNIKSMEGTIEIGLYNKGEKFLEEGHALRVVSIKVKENSETILIKDLPKGTYAISLYHDKNSNGKCDRNFLGIPKEPYGFSNHFIPKFSAPTFKDCIFDLRSDHSMTIKLIH